MGLFSFLKKKDDLSSDIDMPSSVEAPIPESMNFGDAPLPPPELKSGSLDFEDNTPLRSSRFSNSFQVPFPSDQSKQMPESDDIPPPPDRIRNVGQMNASFPPSDTSFNTSSFSKPIQEPQLANSAGLADSTESEENINFEKMTKESKPKSESPEEDDSFELPDFDEDEINEVERLEAESEKEEKEKSLPKPLPVFDKKISYPEPVKMPVLTATKIKDKYTDVKNYMAIKDNVNNIIKTARNTDDRITKHHNAIAQKNETYKELMSGLNIIQDKIILIDNKLFERL